MVRQAVERIRHAAGCHSLARRRRGLQWKSNGHVRVCRIGDRDVRSRAAYGKAFIGLAKSAVHVPRFHAQGVRAGAGRGDVLIDGLLSGKKMVRQAVEGVRQAAGRRAAACGRLRLQQERRRHGRIVGGRAHNNALCGDRDTQGGFAEGPAIPPRLDPQNVSARGIGYGLVD